MAAGNVHASMPCTSDYSTSLLATSSAADETDLEDYDWDALL